MLEHMYQTLSTQAGMRIRKQARIPMSWHLQAFKFCLFQRCKLMNSLLTTPYAKRRQLILLYMMLLKREDTVFS